MLTLLRSKIIVALAMLALLGFTAGPAFAESSFNSLDGGVSLKICESSAVQNLTNLDTVLPGRYNSQVTVSAICPVDMSVSSQVFHWSGRGTYLPVESNTWNGRGTYQPVELKTWSDTGYAARYLLPATLPSESQTMRWVVRGR
jgi:hypothetical protein